MEDMEKSSKEGMEEVHKNLKEIEYELTNNTMTSRVLKAACKVIALKLRGDVLSVNFWGYRIMAKADDDIYIFFVDWSKKEFPDPKITKKKFEEALCDFKDAILESDIENISIIPGHIALWIQGDDRAFVRITKGVELK